ncbi:uncharacterized protein LOC119584308 [Penaeus monodon]|uniref:uncharacterized protein LOC119584308 n=1 Tax=Penaeus monodon TaxID=6687 RepID=UPI0018A75DDF|nr:uncharacterized protein LOC119584308 [Penaeus monodon]XP_037788780.1 uncharacterized protein LOC119584308 [Penaeus monodon]
MLSAYLALIIIATHFAGMRLAGASQEQVPFTYLIPHDPIVATWYPGSNAEAINTISESLCAINCYLRSCVGYSYSEHSCLLEGLGAHSSTARNGGQFYQRARNNMAFQRPAFALSNYPSSSPANAVDDITCLEWSTENQSCCFTSYYAPFSWLVVDLGLPRKVLLIDVGSSQLNNYEVRVGSEMKSDGNFTTYDLFSHSRPKLTKSRAVFVQPEGVVGRFVSIQGLTEMNLRVCDLVVLVGDLN